MSSLINQIYEFGPFRLDTKERCLLREGQSVTLAPKVYETLLALVVRSGHTVLKDELMKQVWPDTFVEESNLTQNIFTLRKALGQAEDGRQYIETVPRRGYRFSAPVRLVESPGAEVYVASQTHKVIITEEEEELELADEQLVHAPSRTGSQGIRAVELVKALDSGRPPLDALTQVQRPVSLTNGVATLFRRPWVLALTTALALVTFIAAIYFFRHKHSTLNYSLATSFQKMRLTAITNGVEARDAVISPDGKYVAYVLASAGQQSLWLRQLDTPGGVQIVPASDDKFIGLTFSPDGSSIYFVRTGKDEPASSLFQISLLGGAPRKLLTDVHSAVTFSPDGKRLAFIRLHAKEGEDSLVAANVDGTDERTVATRRRPEFFTPNSTPAWSPDGEEIACGAGSFNGGLRHSVLAISAKSGEARALTTHQWTHLGRMAWIADGSGLVVSAVEDANSPSFQLWLIAYQSGEISRLTNDLSSYQGLTLSQDSATLATVRTEGTANVWVVPDGDVSRAKQIVSGKYDLGMGDIAWTPDGRIVYRSTATGRPAVWRMDAQGGNQQQLAGAEVSQFSVSPDGRFIIYSSYQTSDGGIWRMDLDGQHRFRLTNGSADQAPQCSPDGQWVIYIGMNSGKLTPWRVSINGGEPTQLVNKFSLPPVISPDGKFVASLSAVDQQGGIKLAVMPFAGGKPIRTFNVPATAEAIIRWTPDGQALTYIDTHSASNLWRQPLDGSPPTQVTQFKDELIFNFDWSSNNNIALIRGVINQDVVVISGLR